MFVPRTLQKKSRTLTPRTQNLNQESLDRDKNRLQRLLARGCLNNTSITIIIIIITTMIIMITIITIMLIEMLIILIKIGLLARLLVPGVEGVVLEASLGGGRDDLFAFCIRKK